MSGRQKARRKHDKPKQSENGSAAKTDQRSGAQAPEGVEWSDLPPLPTNRLLRQTALQQMQQRYGNDFVQRYLDETRRADWDGRLNQPSSPPAGKEPAAIQRVPITAPNAPEELLQPYDASNVPTTDFRPHEYGGGNINYNMTRQGDRSTTVNVRIKFVKRINPTDSPQEIPEGPSRTFARNACRDLVSFWNNKFLLVGRRTPQRGILERARRSLGMETMRDYLRFQPRDVRLRLNFTATPVFDLGADAHKTVALHDEVTADGSALQASQPTVPGQPRSRRIDSGNWFVNRDPNVYPASNESIYAHEYGHLLGIPDEYSLSNPNMHALFHGISPRRETQMAAQLDKAGIREMVLAAIRPRMLTQVRAISGEVAASVAEQQEAITRQVATGLRQAWRDEALIEAAANRIRPQLVAASQNRAAGRLNEALRFEAFENLSNLTIAKETVPLELNAAQIRQLLSSIFTRAATAAEQGTITIPYLNERGEDANLEVRINVAPAAAAGSSPLNASASAAAQASVGQAAPTPPGGRRTPPLYPSHTLIARLTEMPGSWLNLADLMNPQISDMGNKITRVINTMLSNTDLSGQINDNISALYRAMYDLVNNVSQSVVQATVRDFLTAQIRPIMDRQIRELLEMVEEEVDRHQTASGTGTNASPGSPSDPALTAAVEQMQTTARQMLGATTTTTPAGPGGGSATTVTSYNIRFTVNALMGSNSAGESVRADQLERVAASFNRTTPDLRKEDESNFRVQSI